MTENEAIKIIGNVPVSQVDCNNISEIVEAYTVAQKALEEIQQYRAIGLTPKMVKEMIESEKLASHQAIIRGAKLEQYEAIGTIEEFKALKEKSEPKKPNKDEFDRFTCPDCGWIVSTEEYGGRFLPHCENCGQAIDWSE